METPPRTWGRQEKPTRGDFERRNTPTHVGKTVAVRSSMVRGRKHPHARGEDRMGCCHFRLCQETPPRTWGRRSSASISWTCLRNTPTHVGKTKRVQSGRELSEKHPHARGEDAQTSRPCPQNVETPPRTWGRPPPRTWGRPELLQGGTYLFGNTPTHVGKTGTRWRFYQDTEKHPHARGEDEKAALNRVSLGETPPRTWGRLPLLKTMYAFQGNTPTHVGKTPRRGDIFHLQGKHPHARGEDFFLPFR